MKNSKSTAEVYLLRDSGSHNTWADIYIHETGKHSGALLIRSDFGSWDYYWGSCGCPFKEFLIDLNGDYFKRKLMYGREYEFHPEVWFEELRDVLRAEELEEEELEKCMEEVKQVEEMNFRTSEATASYIMNHCIHINRAFDYDAFPSMQFMPRSLIHFMEIWDEFRKLLRQELKEKMEDANAPAK